MFLVGLTGGIATGKSTVSSELACLGSPIVDADLIARQVVEPGQLAWRKIRAQFGPEIFLDDGTLDRKKLGQIIFSDASKRKLLNSITHPEIYKTMLRQIFRHFIAGEQFVVLDLPLLFETRNVLPYLKNIIVVSCDKETQLVRLMNRNCYTEEEAKQRINAQLPLAEKCVRATHVIDNSGNREVTLERVRALYKQLRASRAHWKWRLVVVATSMTVTGLLSWAAYEMLQYLR